MRIIIKIFRPCKLKFDHHYKGWTHFCYDILNFHWIRLIVCINNY